jgi:midasin (ATPase involved in ribosome maturation)
METTNLNEQIKQRLQMNQKIDFKSIEEDLKEFSDVEEFKPIKLTKKPVNNDAAELLKQLGQFMQPQAATIDEAQVLRIVNEALSKQEPKIIEVRSEKGNVKIEGFIHNQFESILNVANQHLHIWLTGTAGAGKTQVCEQVSKALNLPFYSLSVCAQTTESKLLGYNDANGNFVSTIFYEAYKNGGIFLLDEIDNGNANVLSVLNAALANGLCCFACGMVQKHKDFICIAAANTIGTGGNIQYVGRNRIDAATLDRFIMIDFKIDEVLEMNISPNKEFTKVVQELRKKASKKGMSIIISPRASINGGKLINANFSTDEALNMVIFNKLSQQEKEALND